MEGVVDFLEGVTFTFILDLTLVPFALGVAFVGATVGAIVGASVTRDAPTTHAAGAPVVVEPVTVTPSMTS